MITSCTIENTHQDNNNQNQTFSFYFPEDNKLNGSINKIIHEIQSINISPIPSRNGFCKGNIEDADCLCPQDFFKFKRSNICIPRICGYLEGSSVVGSIAMENQFLCYLALNEGGLGACDYFIDNFEKDICYSSVLEIYPNVGDCNEIKNKSLREVCEN